MLPVASPTTGFTMAISLAHLRAIDALARTGQFSKAAQDLGVSQPTISTQVSAFESQSAVRIFIRDGHVIQPAPGAELLLGKIRLALAAIDDIEREITDPQRVASGHVSIGFSAHRLIMPILTTFVERYPRMRVTTRGGPSLELTEAVVRGELDLAFVSQAEPDPRLFNVELRRCRVIVYGQKGHPALASGRIDIRRLASEKLVLWNRLSATRNLIENSARNAGVTLSPVMEVATHDVAYAAAASGMGIAVALEGELPIDSAVDIAVFEDSLSDIGHYLVTLPASRHYTAVSGFIAACDRVEASGG